MNRFGFILLAALLTAVPVRAEDPPEKPQFDFANGLYEREYHPMAVEESRKLLQEFPNAAGADEALYRLGDSLRHLKKHDEAIVAFQIFRRTERKYHQSLS